MTISDWQRLERKRRRKLRIWYTCGRHPMCQHRFKLFAWIHGWFGGMR